MIFVSGGGPYWLAMQGRTYHRVFPTDSTQHEHPAQWLLYDASRRDAVAAKRKVPSPFVSAVRFDLEQHNMLYHVYQQFSEFESESEDAYIELADPGSGNEIAALFHLGNAPYPTPRSLYVQRASDASPIPVPILNSLYEPMQYPLLFPHATPGWGPYLKSLGWTQRAYYHARLLTEQRFRDFSRLACEWICDMFSRTEDERLSYIQRGKAAEAQQFQKRATGNESDDEENDSEDEDIHSFALPASFTGSQKFYANKVADALALARQRGKPDLMITATCNPNWAEIREQLKPGQSAVEVPQVTNRVFKVGGSISTH
jgi:Helitron helicase-like domain at N-terminus